MCCYMLRYFFVFLRCLNFRSRKYFVNEGTRTPGTFVEYFDNCLFCCTISKITGLEDLSLCEK